MEMTVERERKSGLHLNLHRIPSY